MYNVGIKNGACFFLSAYYVKMYSGLFFMMEVKIMSPEKTATRATFTKFCSE